MAWKRLQIHSSRFSQQATMFHKGAFQFSAIVSAIRFAQNCQFHCLYSGRNEKPKLFFSTFGNFQCVPIQTGLADMVNRNNSTRDFLQLVVCIAYSSRLASLTRNNALTVVKPLTGLKLLIQGSIYHFHESFPKKKVLHFLGGHITRECMFASGCHAREYWLSLWRVTACRHTLCE